TMCAPRMNNSGLRPLGVAVLCGAVGFAINVVSGVAIAPMLLGRVVTLPIAIMSGPALGVVSAIVAGAAVLRTTVPAGPALAVLTIEAIVVGVFARRGKSPLVAGAMVWASVALLLIVAPSFIGLDVRRSTAWPLALQLLLNSLVAVVIAELISIVLAPRVRVTTGWRPERMRLRSYAFHAFVLVAMLPVLLLAALDNQAIATRQEAAGAARLHEAVTALAEHITSYVTSHAQAVESLALAMSNDRLTAADRRLLVARDRQIYPGFVTLFHADRNGIVQEIATTTAEQALPPINDRQYFLDAVRTRRLAISDVIMGRLAHAPIVTMAMPVIGPDAQVIGVVGGSLDLSRFERFVDDLNTIADARVTIVDQHSRVI